MKSKYIGTPQFTTYYLVRSPESPFSDIKCLSLEEARRHINSFVRDDMGEADKVFWQQHKGRLKIFEVTEKIRQCSK